VTAQMTALLVILFQLTCHGNQRARGVQFHPTCKLCRESHKTQVWLCFLVLSLLSTSTCANYVQQEDMLQACLKQLKPAIEVSVGAKQLGMWCSVDNCTKMVLKCYMLELIVVIREEEVGFGERDCILDFNNNLKVNVGHCPACETYTLQNITIFLDRLKDLLQKMKST
uniref:Interleukin n=1 Tax=Amphilophus citrinellus TaxID=61819 RepID=A0A3Q0SJY8_AMPCI